MGGAYRLFYDKPLHLVRGEGVWLYDKDGRKYLDMYNNVPHVGHCHPRVVDAICRQAATLNTHTRYLHENVLNLAERLVGKCPEGLDAAMFCCTGSEANELALRIARSATGGTGIIVTDFAYHGNTKLTHEISTDSIPAADLPDYVVTIPTPDTYRGEADIAAMDEALALLERRGIKPCALVMDTIISSGGVMDPPPGYLRSLAEKARAAGALFIADEVQPGFGRTGKNFWGFEADGLVPDIVTMGKPMGNGHPISAIVAHSDLLQEFGRKESYFNTFGGNPVSCAAALAVLDVIDEEHLQDNALDVGNHIVAGLAQLAGKHACIGDVRGTGLFIALDLVTDRGSRAPATELARALINDLRNRGVLTSTIGRHANILKFRPPMVLKKEDADTMLGILDESLVSLG